MAELGVRVAVEGDVGLLTWSAGDRGPDGGDLVAAVAAAADAALAGSAVRRLQASVPAHDLHGRRALLRAGFRLEGVRRQVVPRHDGGHDDEWLFSRLRTDEVGGA